ncbi:MAG: MBL fold metallo-hydrolase [Cetobacterium sp.]|uniref:MBL fold metallo-hydrolase n=1 Tax=unclassified Cetobacterium TaxID=2630983 RepID=UPI00163CC21F|nr:MBL fold metallo-hydrolase [Cetobacterium sp. 2A]MBC2855797.1 MBL fold metallo-hydrolase [Cetobacterium sp. 2A]MBC2857224.1 MBL fold metallo-hydrolase [Cetobacterium sp. 2A]
MNIKNFPMGSYLTNCYLVWDKEKNASLFDCGGERGLDSLLGFLKQNNLNLKNLILTHGHGDHIGGINKLINIFPEIKVYIGKEDAPFLSNSTLSLSQFIQGYDFVFEGDFTTLKEGDTIADFEVIDTPGHTIGSKCFYNKENNLMITGDTLFRRSYGRYDLPTGNFDNLQKSLRKICENYPPETIVYNSHTDSTTLGEEKLFLKSEGII